MALKRVSVYHIGITMGYGMWHKFMVPFVLKVFFVGRTVQDHSELLHSGPGAPNGPK